MLFTANEMLMGGMVILPSLVVVACIVATTIWCLNKVFMEMCTKSSNLSLDNTIAVVICIPVGAAGLVIAFGAMMAMVHGIDSWSQIRLALFVGLIVGAISMLHRNRRTVRDVLKYGVCFGIVAYSFTLCGIALYSLYQVHGLGV